MKLALKYIISILGKQQDQAPIFYLLLTTFRNRRVPMTNHQVLMSGALCQRNNAHTTIDYMITVKSK